MVFVSINKITVVITSLLVALFINEMVVKYAIGYPTFGLDKKVSGIRSPFSESGWQNLYTPYSKYWNVEGGNIVEQRNNFGLPGNDITMNEKTNAVYVLGDSYLEAFQMKRDKMATVIFQHFINNEKLDFSVVNLAYSGHDPYDLYFRLKYFETMFRRGYVILVLPSDKLDLLKRSKNLDFTLAGKQVAEKSGIGYKVEKILRNSFASFNLFKYLFEEEREIGAEKQNKLIERNKDYDYSDKYLLLDNVVIQYYKEYGKDFLLLSTASDTSLNKHLEEFCNNNNINFTQDNISETDYRINGNGHLNEKGNAKLGEFLSKAFKNFCIDN